MIKRLRHWLSQRRYEREMLFKPNPGWSAWRLDRDNALRDEVIARSKARK